MATVAYTKDFRKGDAFSPANIMTLFNTLATALNTTKLNSANFIKGSITQREIANNAVDTAAFIKDREIPTTAVAKKTIGDTQIANSTIQPNNLNFAPGFIRLWTYTVPSVPSYTIYKSTFIFYPSFGIFANFGTSPAGAAAIHCCAGNELVYGLGCHLFSDTTKYVDRIGGPVAGGFIMTSIYTGSTGDPGFAAGKTIGVMVFGQADTAITYPT